MALYKVTQKQSGGGGGIRIPEIIYTATQNIKYSVADFSYTFTESGTFQYYFWVRNSITSSTVVIKLNDTVITPTIDSTGYYAYGEITVSIDDVLNTKTTFTAGDCGSQLFVMKNADVSRFAVIGSTGNKGATFNISTTDSPYLQVYKMGYNTPKANYQYQIGYFDIRQDTEGTHNTIASIPTPNQSAYYYGGTYAIRV